MDSGQQRIIRREEEDDESMLFLLPALHFLDGTNRRQKKPRHISSHTGKELMQEILHGHEKDYRVSFRMEPNIFGESFPRANKFQRQWFPLYYDLEKLYNGKNSIGTLGFYLSATTKR